MSPRVVSQYVVRDERGDLFSVCATEVSARRVATRWNNGHGRDALSGTFTAYHETWRETMRRGVLHKTHFVMRQLAAPHHPGRSETT